MADQRRVDGYGVNFAAMFRRAAAFVDKILKGTKLSDIPVEQATKFASAALANCSGGFRDANLNRYDHLSEAGPSMKRREFLWILGWGSRRTT
jgi:hypothetical protein